MKDVQLLVGANEQLSDNDDKDFEILKSIKCKYKAQGYTQSHTIKLENVRYPCNKCEYNLITRQHLKAPTTSEHEPE